MTSDPNIMAIDLGEEDTEAPELDPSEVNLRPADALRALDEAEKATSEANRAVEAARKAKKRATAVALAVYEHYELDSAKVTLGDRKVLFYTELFRTFAIKDEGKFKGWEAQQAENYYETKVVLREQLFQDEMRRYDDDKQPLPPGVVKIEFPKLKRKADTPRKGK